jgi:hypothetical protein
MIERERDRERVRERDKGRVRERGEGGEEYMYVCEINLPSALVFHAPLTSTSSSSCFILLLYSLLSNGETGAQ